MCSINIALESVARELVKTDVEIRLRRKKIKPIAYANDTVLIGKIE